MSSGNHAYHRTIEVPGIAAVREGRAQILVASERRWSTHMWLTETNADCIGPTISVGIKPVAYTKQYLCER